MARHDPPDSDRAVCNALAAEKVAIRTEFPKFNSMHNGRRHPFQELRRHARELNVSAPAKSAEHKLNLKCSACGRDFDSRWPYPPPTPLCGPCAEDAAACAAEADEDNNVMFDNVPLQEQPGNAERTNLMIAQSALVRALRFRVGRTPRIQER